MRGYRRRIYREKISVLAREQLRADLCDLAILVTIGRIRAQASGCSL